ncbi:Zinc finger, B-box, partial [Cynara cardunculus var. scolymus]
MKIQCNVCEVAEATVLCCADEAALCWACDEKVHAANKLASKHQRVPLSNSNNQMPKCDICQETDGYFFCLEDRALLCRKCDVAIHSLNDLVSSHQRFLLTGVKIGVETGDLIASSVKSSACEKIPETAESLCLPTSAPESANSPYNEVLPTQAAGSGDCGSPKLPFGGGSSIQQWQFDEFFGLNDFNQNYNHVELDDEDCLSWVPDSSWAVPQICSPPTASGLCWSKQHHRHQINSSAAFVPD